MVIVRWSPKTTSVIARSVLLPVAGGWVVVGAYVVVGAGCVVVGAGCVVVGAGCVVAGAPPSLPPPQAAATNATTASNENQRLMTETS